MAKRIKRAGSKRKKPDNQSINAHKTVYVDGVGELELIISEDSVKMVPTYNEILRQQRGIRSIDPDSPMAFQNDRVVKSFMEQGMNLDDAVDSAAIYYEDAGSEIFNTALIISILDTNFEVELVDNKPLVYMAEGLEDIEIEREETDPEFNEYAALMGKPSVRQRNYANPVEQKVSLVNEIIGLGGDTFMSAMRDLLEQTAREVREKGGSEEFDENGFHANVVDGVLATKTDAPDETDGAELSEDVA